MRQTFFQQVMGQFFKLRSSQEVGFLMVHSVHESCVALWGFAWILQWVLTECRTLCLRYRSLGGSAPCSISST